MKVGNHIFIVFRKVYYKYIVIIEGIFRQFYILNFNKRALRQSCLVLLILQCHCFIFSQNEFFIQDGALVFVNNQDGLSGDVSPTDMPTLFVAGDVENLNNGLSSKGFFNNNGEIQVSGNWINSSGGYSSTGDEVLVGNSTQRLSGSFVGTGSRFYNLIIEKNSNTLIELDNDVEVNNILRFGSGGRIRTDVQSYGTDGSAYNNKVVLVSSAPGNIIGYNTTGADKYIEGRFERAVDGANSYFFPIGIAPSSWDGIEPFVINFSSATASFINSYVYPRNINLIGKIVYDDLNGDGLYDKIEIDCELPLQWAVNTSGGTYNYNIEFYPGPLVEICNWDNTYGTPLSFTAKDALIGNIVETTSPFPFANQGLGFKTSPSGYLLSGLTTFSEFTLPGKSDFTLPILPVELILFTAYPVDNSFIELKWITTSEVNNDVFEIERSLDGISFEKIGTVDGKGTTSDKSQYTFQDYNVQYNVLYYYRLKQIDFDGTNTYSNIVAVRLISNLEGKWSVSNFFPNPSLDETFIQVSTDKEVELNYVFYDILGRVLESKTRIFDRGIHLIDYDTEELPTGVYFLSISNNEAGYTKKLTKINDN